MNVRRFALAVTVLAGLSFPRFSVAQQFRTPERVTTATRVASAQEESSSAEQPATTREAPIQPTPAPRRSIAPSATLDQAISGSGMIVSDFMPPMNDPYAFCGPGGCPPQQNCGPRFGVYFDALLLRPGNADVTFAREKSGCEPTSAPTGPVGIVGHDADFGFRVGLSYSWNPQASAVLSYTWFENSASSRLTASPNTVLESLVTYPTQPSCGENSLAASASGLIRFQFLDLDYQRVVAGDCNSEVYVLGGIRFGSLEQSLSAEQNIGTAAGLADVDTSTDFDGFGFRLGAGGEQINCRSGLLLYARGVANFLGGEATGRYQQVNQFGGAIPIALNHEDYRIISILEAEFGIGWTNRSRNWRLSAGYQANAWFNTLTTSEYLRGVQTGIADSLGDTVTFDGLVARIEYQR